MKKIEKLLLEINLAFGLAFCYPSCGSHQEQQDNTDTASNTVSDTVSDTAKDCASDEWGENCRKCTCNERQICDKTDGQCHCAYGFYGEDCLPPDCSHGILDKATGKCGSCDGNWDIVKNCAECLDGYIGPDCTKIDCKNGTIDETTGKCGSCNEGWDIAENCNDCTSDYYGENCENKCACNEYKECDAGTDGLGCQCFNRLFGGDLCKDCIGGYGEDCKPFGSVTDAANNTYKTTIIGTREWMAENLKYEDDDITCYVNTNVPDFKDIYGCLYIFEDAQKACPEGWELPSKDEYLSLRQITECRDYTSTTIRSKDWADGHDRYGFGALPAGSFRTEDMEYFDYKMLAEFLLNDFAGTDQPGKFVVSETKYMDYYSVTQPTSMTMALSVRCIKSCAAEEWGAECRKCDCDENHVCNRQNGNCECPEGTIGPNCVPRDCQNGTIDESTGKCASCNEGWDISTNCTECLAGYYGENCDCHDTNNYTFQEYDGTTWMTENLRNECLADYSSSDSTFLYFYTWESAQKACPPGWRLPTNDEFNSLWEYIDNKYWCGNGTAFLAIIAKSSRWYDDKYYNKGTNNSGFSILPDGYFGNGRQYDKGYAAYFWTATEVQDSNKAYGRYFGDGSTNANQFYKSHGFSIRCIKDEEIGKSKWHSCNPE